MQYFSSDNIYDGIEEHNYRYLVEFFNNKTVSNLASHKLTFNKNAILMLFHVLKKTRRRLCNGTSIVENLKFKSAEIFTDTVQEKLLLFLGSTCILGIVTYHFN